jgi:hypothetical protein
VLFWLYAPLLAVYMRNFAYLCIMVWIHMEAHEYIFFSKFEYFMYFLVNQFCQDNKKRCYLQVPYDVSAS